MKTIEINPYKYEVGDSLVCTSVSEQNFEDLVIGDFYRVVGASVHDGNVVYALVDNNGEQHYSMDRFEFIKPEKITLSSTYGEIKNDPINPNHYKQYGVEVLDIIAIATKKYFGIQATCLANVIKYVLRAPFKNGLEDFKKAKFYLDKLIIELEKN